MPERTTIGEHLASWLRDPQRAGKAEAWGEHEQRALRWALQVHGVAPLLHEVLATAGQSTLLPPALRAYLAEQHALSSHKMRAMQQELGELIAAFAAAGLPLMPLKGAVLARDFYPQPGLRPSADIDLLVCDEPAAVALMRGLRYDLTGRSARHASLARPEQRGPVVSYEGEHPDNPREVELHTRIGLRFWSLMIDITEQAWRTSRPWPWASAAAHRPDEPTLLLHLLLHTADDMIARRLRLLQLYDIALVAARLSPSDWNQLVEFACARREERLLYAPLSLAARHCADIPPEVLARLRGRTHAALRVHLDAASLDSLSLCNAMPSSMAERLCWFRPGFERARALRHALLPNPGEVAVWFPQENTVRRLPLAYARYAAVLVGWALQRALGGRRRMRRRHDQAASQSRQ
jgi:hypothetical protein